MATSNIKGSPFLDSGVGIQVINIGADVPAYYEKEDYALASFEGPYSILVIGYECVKTFSSVNTRQSIGYSGETNVAGLETGVVTIENGKIKFTQSNRQYTVFSPKQTKLVESTNS